MEYYHILGLKKEPFSNSPDPDFFFKSNQHLGCLQKLDLAIRLKRGLNIVIGNVGSGKTTLCRELIRRIAADNTLAANLILDPSFGTPLEFLKNVAAMLTSQLPADLSDLPVDLTDEYQLKEMIKHSLFYQGVDQKKNIVLIIDEGQKIPEFCLELLREFLNFETNDSKLLQIIIFAQPEFKTILAKYPNFADRVNLLHILKPMSFKDTRLMIQYRLSCAMDGFKQKNLFTLPALWVIYRATKGYPRKIINLCHQNVLTMIIQNRSNAGMLLVRSCISRAIADSTPMPRKFFPKFIPSTIALLLCIILTFIFSPQLSTVETKIEHQFQSNKFNKSSIISPGSINLLKTEINQLSILPVHKSFQNNKKLEKPLVPKTKENLPKLSIIPEEFIVKENDTLCQMILDVYGSYSYSYLQEIMAVNPQLSNPDKLEIGTRISFPLKPYKK